MSFFEEFVRAVWLTGTALAPSLFLGFLIAGLLHVLVKRDRIFRHIGKPGLSSVVKASLIGVPLPLCSCGVLPAALSLRRDGASKGAAVSFLSSTPQTGVDSIAPTWALLGWPVALAKVLAAFLAGVISGSVVDLLEKGNGHQAAPAVNEPVEKGSVPLRIWKYAFGTLFRDIYVWLFIGVAVSALITVFIEPGRLAEYPVLEGPVGILAALAVGIPMYVCSVSSIPIAAALVYAGFPVGSALVFLMAGPVTNAATMGAVRKKLGRTAFLSYIITVISVSVLAGLLLNGLEISVDMPAHHHGGNGLLQLASAALLFMGMAYLGLKDLRLRLAGSRDSTAADRTVYSVQGMSCMNCVRKVSEAVSGVPGAMDPDVDLEKGTVTVTLAPGVSGKSVMDRLEKAGYPARPLVHKEECCDGTCERN